MRESGGDAGSGTPAVGGVGFWDNAGVWDPSRWRPSQRGSWRWAILQLFSQKYPFLGIFWSKFLPKTAFIYGWIKCVDAPRGARSYTCPPPLLCRWVNRLKAMTNNIAHTVVSDIMLFSLNHLCFLLLMRDRAQSIYSTFAIHVALLYLFFKSWNCWIFTDISLSK